MRISSWKCHPMSRSGLTCIIQMKVLLEPMDPVTAPRTMDPVTAPRTMDPVTAPRTMDTVTAPRTVHKRPESREE